jgi:hypothetical protein
VHLGVRRQVHILGGIFVFEFRGWQLGFLRGTCGSRAWGFGVQGFESLGIGFKGWEVGHGAQGIGYRVWVGL